MQQGNDFGPQYYTQGNKFPPTHPIPNPTSNPNEYVPSNPIQPSYASAPPYSQYPTSEYPIYSSSSSFAGVHSTFSPNLDPIQSMPPSAPSYAQTQSQSQAPPSKLPSYTPFSSSPFQSEQSSVPLSAPYHLPQPSSAPYYNYDSHHSNPDLGHTTNLNPPFSSAYVSSENPYDGAGYFNEHSGKYDLSNAGSYAQAQPSYDHDYYEKSLERGFQSMNIGAQDDGLGDGVYAYDGGRAEPYGARGTIPKSSSSSPWGGFDDYGRSVGISSGRNDQAGGAGKIARAVPKAEAQQDVKNGVQKFRVKLLPEGASVNTMDVLCQIGLDGIRMVDPSSNMTLRVYPLESVTRWEVLDSSIFCFWSKTSIDVEPKRIRLKSNSYTTNTILDTVTAATVQFKEMGGSDVSQGSRGSAEGSKLSEKSNEKRKGFGDWMNLMKPDNLEKDHWVPDEAVSQCTSCGVAFGPFVRRHHCRNCGDIFCDKCSQGRTALTADESAQPVRVCDGCMAEVTQRLSNAKEASRSVAVKSHEVLARKLQEEMERTRKSSSGSKSSDSSGRKTREVACPICTVHLQVQIPNSGSETIECGVCQHPFLVSAH